jgi:hypothetical protein
MFEITHTITRPVRIDHSPKSTLNQAFLLRENLKTISRLEKTDYINVASTRENSQQRTFIASNTYIEGIEQRADIVIVGEMAAWNLILTLQALNEPATGYIMQQHGQTPESILLDDKILAISYRPDKTIATYEKTLLFTSMASLTERKNRIRISVKYLNRHYAHPHTKNYIHLDSIHQQECLSGSVYPIIRQGPIDIINHFKSNDFKTTCSYLDLTSQHLHTMVIKP